jgi:hypothetical protein
MEAQISISLNYKTVITLGAIALTLLNLGYIIFLIRKCVGSMKKAYAWAGMAIFMVLLVLIMTLMLDYEQISMDSFHFWLVIFLGIAAICMTLALKKMYKILSFMPAAITEKICKYLMYKP